MTDPKSQSTSPVVAIISIRFSKSIAAFNSNNFTITPVNADYTLGLAMGPSPQILSLVANEENTLLRVNVTDVSSNIMLQANAIYMAEVSKIKDSAGNEMSGVCRWLFATGSASVDPSKVASGLCDTAIPSPTFAVARFDFEVASSTVNEAAGTVDITVLRTAGSIGSVTVDYTRVNGSAIAGSDYNTVSGTLSFADGIRTQVISVTITNDLENDTGSASGAVYIFTRGTARWIEQAYIKASNTGNLDYFGTQLVLSSTGNSLAVAARGESSSSIGINSIPNELAFRAGAVYVFTRAVTTWSQSAYIKASNTSSYDSFGTSLSLSGDGSSLLVGAPAEDSNSTGVNSAVNELLIDSTGKWIQQAYVKASNTGKPITLGNRWC